MIDTTQQVVLELAFDNVESLTAMMALIRRNSTDETIAATQLAKLNPHETLLCSARYVLRKPDGVTPALTVDAA